MTGTVLTTESPSDRIYFWDDDDAPTGTWTLCLAGANDLSDCNRDATGEPKPGGSNDYDSEILRIFLTINFDTSVNGGVINFDTDYVPAPVITYDSADGTTHATMVATFSGSEVIFNSLPALSAPYEIDRHYHVSDTTFDDDEIGTLDDVADLTLDSLTLGLRYYPELPDWAFTNGWHDSVMMAYANVYRPDVLGGDCGANPPCLQINGLAGVSNDKISIVTLAGEHQWEDGSALLGVAADGSFADELGDVFNLENSILDNIFDMRTIEDTGAPGDTQLDKILVIEQL